MKKEIISEGRDIVVSRLSNGNILRSTKTQNGAKLLAQELEIFKKLTGNKHVAKLIDFSSSKNKFQIELEYIEGEALGEWLNCSDEYTCKPKTWAAAKNKFKQYIEAEMSLLSDGVLYRDLQPGHLFFDDEVARFIDIEAAAVRTSENKYVCKNMRGTWETMAPEELARKTRLTKSVATYRAAILAHLILYGYLPYRNRAKSRKKEALNRNKIPSLEQNMDKKLRKLFLSALSPNITRRPKDPASFLEKLELII